MSAFHPFQTLAECLLSTHCGHGANVGSHPTVNIMVRAALQFAHLSKRVADKLSDPMSPNANAVS